MYACKVMLKVSLDEAKARFQNCDDVEFSGLGDWSLVEDTSGTALFGWETSSWLELAQDSELAYAYYDEDRNAEFFHIKDGACLRAYQEYGGEVDTDEGDDPQAAIKRWADVAEYMDHYMI